MAHLIDKDALVAEIKELSSAIKIQLDHKKGDAFWIAQKLLLERLKGKINSLEVKEVDLDIQTFAKEMDTVFALPSSETKNTEENPLNWEYAIAKHFYELGLSVSNKAQKGK